MQKLFEFIEHIGKWRVLVQTRDIQNGAITSRHIVDDAVTTEKIGDGEVKSGNIAPKAVTTEKLPDLSVTSEKLADYAVTSEKIADGSVGSSAIAPESVTVEKLAPGAIDESKIVLSDVVIDAEEDTGDIVVYYINNGYVNDAGMDEETGDVFLELGDGDGGGSGGSSEEMRALREEVDDLRERISRQENTNLDSVINTDKEVHDFLDGYGEEDRLEDKIGDNMTDEDILDTFGYKPGDVDFDDL